MYGKQCGELILQSWGERVNRVNQRLRIEDCGLSFLRDQQLGQILFQYLKVPMSSLLFMRSCHVMASNLLRSSSR